MYFIQGFFCDERSGLGTKTVPVEGVVTVIHEAVVLVMFAGVIFHLDPDPMSPLAGWMIDDDGKAELTDIVINEREVRFLKRYEGRTQSKGISYVLRPDGNTWSGEYTLLTSGGRQKKGPARCVITEATQTLFEDDLRRFFEKCNAMH